MADATGPTHPYMLSSPACWDAYGEVLAREYQDPALFAACHRLTVDAYALQHPGDPDDRRAARSVALHFASLYAINEQGRGFDEATVLLKRKVTHDFAPLPNINLIWTVTIADVRASSLAEHAGQVERWARCVYHGWAPLLAARTRKHLAAV